MPQVCRLFALCSVLLLTACAHVSPFHPVKNRPLAWKQHQAQVSVLNSWQASGVVSVRVGKKSQSANVLWKQTGDQFAIEFYGPLGIGASYLTGGPGKVRLALSNGKVYQANNAEKLMQETLGWSVPVEGLVYWVRGLPVSHQSRQLQINSYGFLGSLQQAGWQINYQQYQKVGLVALPEKMSLQQGNLTVKLVVSHWGLG